MPDVLVADDNPLSLRFLCDALGQLGLAADAAGDGAAVLACAARATYTVMLLDRRMPGLSGEQTLQRLRAAGVATVAIATSAEVSVRDRDELHAAGFVAVLEKPFALATLHTALRPYFGERLPALAATASALGENTPATGVAVLDDGAALPGVGGDRGILNALRRLLIGELEQLVHDLNDAEVTAPAEFGERLHRLQASAGFCGARRLSAACVALREQLRSDSAAPGVALRTLRAALDATLAALQAERA